MKVYLASDHTAFEIKEKIKAFLSERSYEVEDCGAYEYDKNDDYPDFIGKAAEGVSKNPTSIGIVFGGSGQGEAMAANKSRGVRCALFYSKALPTRAVDITGKESTNPFEIVKLARLHNDANILSLGIRFLTEGDIIKAITIFLDTPFSEAERHIRRIDKVTKLENV